MFIFKKLVFLIIFILINGCTLNNFEKKQSVNNFSIEVNTPNDKYNIYLKENLKRFFYANNNQNKFILKTKITFDSTKSLSVSGQNILKSTKAKIDYQLIDKNTNIIVKSGSINTFPALSSSSNSLYAQENSIDFIKERLTKSSAKSLYSHFTTASFLTPVKLSQKVFRNTCTIFSILCLAVQTPPLGCSVVVQQLIVVVVVV